MRRSSTLVERPRRHRSARWILCSGLVVIVAGTGGTAHADMYEWPSPADGCIATTAAAVGFYETTVSEPTSITLDVPGPIIQASVEWMGIWDDPPVDPELDVEVEGPAGTESGPTTATVTAQDNTGLNANDPIWAMGYVDDITELFGIGDAGSYIIELTPPPDSLGPPENHWYGATVTIAYDTGDCDASQHIVHQTGADFYFGGDPNTSATTELLVFELDPPLTSDFTTTIRLPQGGADTTAASCSVSMVWLAMGTGTAPSSTDDLIDDDGNPVYPGAVEGVDDPFTPPNQPCAQPVLTPPVIGISGGHVGPQYALIEIDVQVPAGSSWIALQLESPRDNNGLPALPEAGVLGGAALSVPAPVTNPSIAIETTVLPGSGGACPGVNGSDELVTGVVDTPVTYCFRVSNTGDARLFPVTISDAGLAIDTADLTLVSGDDTTPLAVGGELVYSYVSAITADLVNTATVTATAIDFADNPLDAFDPVTASDGAEVDLLVSALDLEQTIIAGPAGQCPGVNGTDEQFSGVTGTPVTYCFRVTNTGDTPLYPVTVDAPALGVTSADMTLVSGDAGAPLTVGDSLTWRFEAEITSNLVSVATATGVPSDAQGAPLTAPAATATDDASTVLEPPPTTTTTTQPTTTTSTTTTTTLPSTAAPSTAAPTTTLVTNLPATGGDATRLAWWAFGLTALGVVLLIARRHPAGEG